MMNITFQPERRGNVENKTNNNSLVNIRFLAKTLDTSNFSQNINQKWQRWMQCSLRWFI